MSFIFNKTTIISGYPPEVLIDKLKRHFSWEFKMYSGSVDGHSFKMERPIRNRFEGRFNVKGMIDKTDGGSSISLTTKPHIITLVSVAAFTAIFIYAFLNTNIFSVSDTIRYVIAFFVPLIVVLTLYLRFVMEVKGAETFLLSLFRENVEDVDDDWNEW